MTNTTSKTQERPKPAVASSGLFCFRWWYKGRTEEGNILKFKGRVVATNDTSACSTVEAIMRAEHPTVRWMHGREIEGSGVSFGPTVQKLKIPVEAAKQNSQLNQPGCD